MRSEVHRYEMGNGEIQKVHLVKLDCWEELQVLKPKASDRALDCFARIYRQYLVPAAPWVFGSLVLFRLPEGAAVPFAHDCGHYGTVAEPLTAAAIGLHRGVRILGKQVFFRDRQTEAFWKDLKKRDCIRIVQGKLPITTVIGVGEDAGFLTESEPDAALKVNSFFFTMDPFDCATVYDHIGRPFGLFVKDGVVEQPPLFSREALLVKQDGSISIEKPKLKDLTVRIGGHTFIHGQNCSFYERPQYACTPPGKGKRLVILNRKVAAVSTGGCVGIPGAGFVICTKEDADVRPGDAVSYQGLEHIRFGIQVGNSIVCDGIPTERFQSRFFNVRGLNRIAFPPSLYPLNYIKSRAARIAIGADREGRPMLLWAEGAAKIGHIPGEDSIGASLSDMARICTELGMVNGVNLDGGGSAQLLLKNLRSLKISDRAADGMEMERPVPMGLLVE